MKKIILLLLIFCCASVDVDAQSPDDLTNPISNIKIADEVVEDNLQDVTDYIQNPSFETDGLNGWTNNGMQSQTNNSPVDQGWSKDGNVYAEKWVSSDSKLSDARISQVLSGLPNGKYQLRVIAHAINQSGTPSATTGAYVYAGINETQVTTGQEYAVETTIIDGNLEIGFKTENTEANWVAFDHFRLYYCGNNVAFFNELLNDRLQKAVEDTLSTGQTGYFNIQRYRDAISAAQNAAQTEDAIIAAITELNAAMAETIEIREQYKPLKEAIERLTEELAITNYPDLATVRNVIDAAQKIYDSKDDQRANIQTAINALNTQSQILSNYSYLGNELGRAKDLLNSSEYPDKTLFEEAINTADAVFNNPEGKDVITAVTDLNVAISAYLNGRPSNWNTIKNGAMWKDRGGNWLQAHGAGFVQVGDTWYMIGEDRSNSWNPDVNMYSTKDFVNWKFERKIIQNGITHPDLGRVRFVERPKIMYNKKTGKYVVWCHWESSNYGASEAAVFYSDVVNGPYTFHWAGRPLGIKSRDCTVFVDDDDTAYFISTTEENQHLGLFRLSDDYLSVVEHTELFSGQRREAPAVVKIDGTYFMLFSACSGWDPNQTSFSWSKSLTSGWSGRSNIGNPNAFDTQPASILTLQGREGTSYLFVGDRWQDPDLPESKTVMFPISFNESAKTVSFNYKQQFDLDLATGTYRETDTSTARVPKQNWSINSVSSEETSSENGSALNAIDGNPNTKWHTKYSGVAGTAPHFIEVDMGAEYEVSGFLAMPRMDGSINGTIREFLFMLSTDGNTWETVSGGTWLPYGGEVYFQPARARYFRMVSLAGAHACIVDLDVLMNTPEYTPNSIIPYYQQGANTNWAMSDNITVDEGSRLRFGPSHSARGTWAIAGPNNHMSGGREYEITNTVSADAGIYTFVLLDIYAQSSKIDYNVSITGGSSIEGNDLTRLEVDRKYYNLQGVEIRQPDVNKMYIVKIIFDDGSAAVEKIIYQQPK